MSATRKVPLLSAQVLAWGFAAAAVLAPAPAAAFEEVLRKGPSMGPIDAERPPPKYISKDNVDEVIGQNPDTKKHEDFSAPTLDLHPVFTEALPRWGVELRAGPYRPAFSSQAQAQALYDLIMVQDDESMFKGRPMMLAIEGDYYFLRTLGLLGAYGRVGFWQASAASRACMAEDNVTLVPCNSTTVFRSIRGNDTATLTHLPLSLGALWRFDLLKRRTPVPLLFTAKLGLDGHFWWGSSGGHRARYNGRPARGATLGWQASVGMSLNVDGFAKRALSRIRSRVENNLFVELATVRGHALVGPARHDRLDFTDNRMVTVGLACDFK